MKKILLALLLVSCTKQSHWAFSQIHSERKEFRSTKLACYAQDPIYGIDLEFLNADERLNLYLNVHSVPITPHQGDPKSALLTLGIDGKKTNYLIYRFAGGQRFLASEEVTQLLITALEEGKEISVSLVGYRTLVKPEDFSTQFKKLKKPITLENPFRLPF